MLTVVFRLIRTGLASFEKRLWPLLGVWFAVRVLPELVLQVGAAVISEPEGKPVAAGIVVFGILWALFWVLYFALTSGLAGVLLATPGDLPVRKWDVYAKRQLDWQNFVATVMLRSGPDLVTVKSRPRGVLLNCGRFCRLVEAEKKSRELRLRAMAARVDLTDAGPENREGERW